VHAHDVSKDDLDEPHDEFLRREDRYTEDESHGNGKQATTNLSSESRGTLTGSGLDLETKIFSASGRGETFLLTSLFMELIEALIGNERAASR
jgi:hypothetical protein